MFSTPLEKRRDAGNSENPETGYAPAGLLFAGSVIVSVLRRSARYSRDQVWLLHISPPSTQPRIFSELPASVPLPL